MMTISKNHIVSFLAKHKVDLIIAGILLCIAALPRLIDLGTFLTADEKNWIGRSYEFVKAFKEFRFNDMLQTTHPGVTALWIMGITVYIKSLTSNIPFSFDNLFHFVKASQFTIAFAITLTIPLIYALLRRISNSRELSTLATLLIALDPLLIGYSRVAHVDALLAHLICISALSLIVYVRENHSRRWLFIAAVFSGFAILTKVPAVFLLPYFILLVITATPFTTLKATWRQRLRDLFLWLLIIVVMFVTIWPAVIFVPNPKGNILVLKRDIGQAAITPHNSNDEYTFDAWHYPAALLARTTPLLQTSVIVFVIQLIFFRKKLLTSSPMPLKTYWWLVAYVFFFIVMMILGAKKGDRYILSVWPVLNILAAAGVWTTVSLLMRNKYSNRTILAVCAVVVTAILGFTVVRYHPYAIAYHSPLFPSNLSQELGWGEGLEQVATWLNKTAPNAVVASWYPEELGVYTTARVAHINAHEQGKVQYIVLYKNMFGRSPEHYANDFIDEYFKKRQPVFVAHVAGQEFAWVYEKKVYERIVGELVPSTQIRQEIVLEKPGLSGFDLLLANYSGKATTGDLHITAKDAQNALLGEWHVPVKDIEDNRWRTFRLASPLSTAPNTIVIEVSASRTSPGNAPTMRYTSDFNYRSSTWEQKTANDSSFQKKPGDIAVRLRFFVNQKEATEDDTRLLSQ